MKKTVAVLAVALVAFFTSGCFQIEQSIELKKDLSGTADFHLGVDFEPMVYVMAQFAREMEGKKGPPSEAELAKAKADFKKNSKKSGDDKMPSKAEIQKDLPPGVKILDFKAEEKEFGVTTDFKFGFDRINRLVDVKLPGAKGAEQDPTKKNVIDTPFEGLEVVEKGNLITIRTKPQNPTETVKEQAADAPKLDNDTDEMGTKAVGTMRVAYKITAPFTVVSHNATRKEGNTLIWEYDMKRFEQIAASKKPEDFAVRVTYKK